MARPSKSGTINYSETHDLTHGLLQRASCPNDKSFVLVKDREKRGLRLRVTKVSGKHWQFETRLKGKLITRALGEWPAMSIADARQEAHRLRGLTESGIDPRDLERQKLAQRQADLEALRQREHAEYEAAKQAAITVRDSWTAHVEDRRPTGAICNIRAPSTRQAHTVLCQSVGA